MMRRVAGVLVLGLALIGAPAASAAGAHGDVIHVFKPGLNTNQSGNWFGYNQGTLEQGGTQFHSITGNWTVPTASAHQKGQDEFSSTWIGIGGGCVDANCFVGDSTLIQTGTEQDVGADGSKSYSAWWEIIPAPSIPISMTVAPGDKMFASIVEQPSGSENWTITLKDLTRRESFTQTVPYTSTHATAEWIEETPVVLDSTGSGFAALPNLTKTPFDFGTVNGQPAGLKSSEEIQLVDGNGNVIGAPSSPDKDHDGFGDCAWATTCSPPKS